MPWFGGEYSFGELMLEGKVLDIVRIWLRKMIGT